MQVSYSKSLGRRVVSPQSFFCKPIFAKEEEPCRDVSPKRVVALSPLRGKAVKRALEIVSPSSFPLRSDESHFPALPQGEKKIRPPCTNFRGLPATKARFYELANRIVSIYRRPLVIAAICEVFTPPAPAVVVPAVVVNLKMTRGKKI